MTLHFNKLAPDEKAFYSILCLGVCCSATNDANPCVTMKFKIVIINKNESYGSCFGAVDKQLKGYRGPGFKSSEYQL